jgi:hypothetical protein
LQFILQTRNLIAISTIVKLVLHYPIVCGVTIIVFLQMPEEPVILELLITRIAQPVAVVCTMETLTIMVQDLCQRMAATAVLVGMV